MSRSGYSYDCDNWELIRYRGAVASAVRGARGQQLLKDLRDALDAMPEKRLIANTLEGDEGVCALGALGKARGLDMSQLDPDDYPTVAGTFNIAEALAREIVFENDEELVRRTPEQRWQHMRNWVVAQIRES